MPAELADDFRTAGLTHLAASAAPTSPSCIGFVLLAGRRAGLRGRWLPAVAAVAMVGFVVLARPQPSVLRAAVMGAVAPARRWPPAAARREPRRARCRRARAAARRPVAGALLRLRAVGRSRPAGWCCWRRAGRGGWPRAACPRPLAEALAVAARRPARLRARWSCCSAVRSAWSPCRRTCSPARPSRRRRCSACSRPSSRRSASRPPRSSRAAPVLPAGGSSQVARPRRRAAGRGRGLAGVGRGRCALAVVVVLVVVVARVPAARGPLPAPRPRGGGPGRVALVGAGAVAGLAAARLGAGVPATSGRATRSSSPPAAGTAVVVDAGPDPARVDRCLRGLRRPAGAAGAADPPARRPRRGTARRAARPPGRGGAASAATTSRPAELARVPRWAAAARRAGARATVRETGWRSGPVSWRVLWPARVIDEGSVPNNASVVLLVRSRGLWLLLTGDVEPPAQRALLGRARLARGRRAQGRPPRLGVPGPAGCCPSLRPRVALVSVGAGNDYGHPAPSTLRALRRSGALVGRTDTGRHPGGRGDPAAAPAASGRRVAWPAMPAAPVPRRSPSSPAPRSCSRDRAVATGRRRGPRRRPGGRGHTTCRPSGWSPAASTR